MRRLKSFLFIAGLVIGCLNLASAQTAPTQIVGKTVAEIKGKTLDGKDFSLSQNFRGAPTMIVFWSTTCPICHANIPKMNKLKSDFAAAGKSANFLAVTMDNPSKVNNYIRKNPFNFTILPNTAASLIEYAPTKNGVPAMANPSIFVVDKNGVLVYAKEGGNQTETIGNLLNNLLQSK